MSIEQQPQPRRVASGSLAESLLGEFEGAEVRSGNPGIDISRFIFDAIKSVSEGSCGHFCFIDLDGFGVVKEYNVDNQRRLLLTEESANLIIALLEDLKTDSKATGEIDGVTLELTKNGDNNKNILEFLDKLHKKHTFNINAEPSEDAEQYLNRLFASLRKEKMTVSGRFNDMELQLFVEDANFIRVVFERARENNQPTTAVFKGRFLTIDPNNNDTTNKNILEFISVNNESGTGIVQPSEGETEEDFKFKLIGMAISLGKEVVGKYDETFYAVTIIEGKAEIKKSKEKPQQAIKLPKEVFGVLDLTNIKKEDELKKIELPQVVHGDIRLDNLEWVKHLKLPEIVTGNVYLSELRTYKGMLPELPAELGGVVQFGESIKDVELYLLKQKYPYLKDKILPKRDIEYSEESEQIFQIWHKVDSGQDLTTDEIHFLYKDYFEASDNVERSYAEPQSEHEPEQYPVDVRAFIFSIIDRRKDTGNLEQDLATLFECKPEEISVTEEEALSGGKKYHYGPLSVNTSSGQQVDLPERIFNPSYSVSFSLSGIEKVDFPNIIRIPSGDINVIKLNDLKDFTGVVMPELGYLQEFHARRLERATGLAMPKEVEHVYLNSLLTLDGVRLPEKMDTLHLDSLVGQMPKDALDKLHTGTKWLYLPVDAIPSGYLEDKKYEILEGSTICLHNQ